MHQTYLSAKSLAVSRMGAVLLLSLVISCNAPEFEGTPGRSAKEDKRDETEGGPDSGPLSPDGERTAAEDSPDDADDSGEADDGDPGEAGDGEAADSDGGALDDEGDVSESADGDLSEDGQSVRNDKCGTDAEVIETVRLDFPSTRGHACDWGHDGNLSPADTGIARAVHGQTKSFEMKDGAKICSVQFEGLTPDVSYDDFIHLTFDGFILASAQFKRDEFLAMGMEETGSLIKYDRKKHIGKGPYDASLNTRTNAICPAGGTCSMVKSQTSGSFQVDAPKSWFDLMPADVIDRKKHDFAVWVTGQAHASDCQHSGLNFNLKIRYVE